MLWSAKPNKLVRFQYGTPRLESLKNLRATIAKMVYAAD